MRKLILYIIILNVIGGIVSPHLLGRDFYPEDIKLLLKEMKASLATDADSMTYWIGRFSELAATVEAPAASAVLHSMAAELYLEFRNRNRRHISSRTPLAGYVPDDIREWTDNLFGERIALELDASLRPARLLQQTLLAGKWTEILAVDKAPLPSLNPTLYDFLANRAMEIQASEAIYSARLAFRRSQPDLRALIMTEIAGLNRLASGAFPGAVARREAALDSLLRAYDGAESSVEIVHELVAMRMWRESRHNGEADSLRMACWELCRSSIERFPRYDRINLIRQDLQNLEAPLLSARSASTACPGQSLELRLEYRNLKSARLEVYATSLSPMDVFSYRSASLSASKRRKAKLAASVIALPEAHPALRRDSVVLLPAISKPGIYEYVIRAEGGKETAGIFAVSRPAAVARVSDFGSGEILVTDMWSGAPLPGAELVYYRDNAGAKSDMKDADPAATSLRTDADGFAPIPAWADLYGYKAKLGADSFALISYLHVYGRHGLEDESEQEKLTLITDRAIYRLGQTVRFKAILIRSGDEPAPVEGRRLKVGLRDANDREVSAREYVTGEYGSFHGEFVLPSVGLTGYYTLEAGINSVQVRVEQYKRPGFGVEVEPVRGEIVFGDELHLHGRAATFAGLPLSGAVAEYVILRRPWLMRHLYSGTEVASGSCTLDAEGGFALSFRPSKEEAPYNSYEIRVRVTDAGGETQEGRAQFSVGDRSLVLLCNLQGMVDKDRAQLRIEAQTLNGESVPAEVQYFIHKIKDTKEGSPGEEGELIAQGVALSGNLAEANRIGLSSLPSGRIRLRLRAQDTKGREVESAADLVLYSRSDARPPVFSALWTPSAPEECLPGDTAEIVFGTSLGDTYIICEAWDGPRLIVRKWERLSDECRRFGIPFGETYRSLTLSVAMVKEGAYHSARFDIRRKEPSRALRILPQSFRDRTQPGATESLTLRVEADSVPVEAEITAGMYDASLDELQPFAWEFEPLRPVRAGFRSDMPGAWLNIVRGAEKGSWRDFSIPAFRTERIDWGDALATAYGYATRAGGLSMKSARNESAAVEARDVMAEADAGAPALYSVASGPDAARADARLRENFAETAFFYPQLRSDGEKGECTLQFTLPDGNTTWKLQALAHTKEARHGLYSAAVVARKDFMIQPYVPRFIRRGDVTGLSARVVNLSAEAVEGEARLELFEPETGRAVAGSGESRAYSLRPGESQTLDWSLVVRARPGAIGCRFVAEGGGASDGEQHLIPLLSELVEVTDATPFYLYEEQPKVIELPPAPVEVESTVIELSSNPVWYAVQALPVLAGPVREDAVSRFASYYAHSLASHIAQTNPRLREVIAAMAEAKPGGELSSALERGSSATGVGLSETPWANAARLEADRIRSLSRLFDTNLNAYLREESFRALASEQNPDGGWGWFKGMHSDRTITICILQGMIVLREAGAVEYNQLEKAMMFRALGRLDRLIASDYESLRRQAPLPDALPGSEQLAYLCLRSEFRDVPEPSQSRAAIRYYTAKAEEHQAKAGLADRARIAILMHNNGKRPAAVRIVDDMRKTAVTSPELGMYWPNNRGGYFHSAVDVHCLALTAFRLAGAEASEVARLRQWLLSQKQTQSWEPNPSTVNAIAALLSGSKWTDRPNRMTVRWGGSKWEPSEGDAGTGYARLKLSEALPSSPEVEKSGPAPAWGAVYRSYHAPVSVIAQSKGALHLEKKLFVETRSDDARRLRAVEPGDRLKVGDKLIVRLVIRADRAMDYVCLTDMRPGCIEPVSQLSGAGRADGQIYYRSPGDDAERFYFDHLSSGTHVMEYAGNVVRSGRYSCGIATLRCSYAPEFTSRAVSGYELEVVREDPRRSVF
ncbi:MAG: hypothetical protein LBD21_00105 [Tannerellaceae bacterium]|nr:hypothetical protein [Tannerellaceae bacterium]